MADTWILGIESSCDETAASVVQNGRVLLSSVVASQVEEHKLYGGVVPEIASRRHCENICGVVKQALEDASLTLNDLSGIAVTYAPGLIGALLVGVNYAKGLAFSANKPLIPVHHLRGHIAANYIAFPDLAPPFLCMVASGGHSHIIEVKDYTTFHVIGRTRDDAAGEAFDKAARAMGYPYPGGKYIDEAAKAGDPAHYPLPHPKVDGSVYDFSFSGLKTAVLNLLNTASQKGETICKEDLAASFQKTVCDVVANKLMAAAEEYGYQKIVLAGGVAANSGLRDRLMQECDQRGFSFFVPPLSLCGDNAAMIASQGYFEFQAKHIAGTDLNAAATKDIEVG